MSRRTKDPDIAQTISNADFIVDVYKALARAVEERGGSVQHLRRIVTDKLLQQSIAEAVMIAAGETEAKVETPHVEGDALPPDHYRVNVTYAPLPSLDTLKAEFGEKHVSDIFDGRPFELHSSCAEMSRTPGDRIFFMHSVGRKWMQEERIAWGLRQRSAVAPNGYRPATHEETYEFQKAHPELIMDYVALGSSAMRGDQSFSTTLWHGGGQRFIGSHWIALEIAARCRVLFVRKDLPKAA